PAPTRPTLFPYTTLFRSRGGGDLYTTSVQRKVYVGSPNPAGGHYSQSKETFQETNFSARLTAKKDELFGLLGGSIMVGGNLMNRSEEHTSELQSRENLVC